MSQGGVTALVLAGSRAGKQDPVALAGGTSHKALVQVGGVPMLSRVLHTLRACPQIGRIVVCAQGADALLAELDGANDVLGREGEAGPSRSVGAMLAEFGTPLLVTTADHPLLSPAMVAHLLADARSGVDVFAAVASAATVLAAFPKTKRTWLRFRGATYTGCNLFLLCHPQAAGVIAFWERLEQARKHPMSLAKLLGAKALILYALRLGSLETFLGILGQRTGARLGVVDLPFAEAAVDVDKPEDLLLVETILARRLAA